MTFQLMKGIEEILINNKEAKLKGGTSISKYNKYHCLNLAEISTCQKSYFHWYKLVIKIVDHVKENNDGIDSPKYSSQIKSLISALKRDGRLLVP